MSDEEFPACPDCGERHEPDPWSKSVFTLIKSASDMSEGNPTKTASLLLTCLYRMLTNAPLEMQLHVLTLLAEAWGIQTTSKILPKSGAVVFPGNNSVN